jgi:hypothetical protein
MARVVNETTYNAKAGTGEAFFISHVFLAVPNAGKVYLRHKSGSTKYLHSILDIETVGQWRLKTYSGTTFTADGTALEAINRRSDSTTVLDSLFWHTPTINVLGTLRLDSMFGSGTNPAKTTTGEFGETIESIFAPDADVLIELENLSGSEQYLSAVFNVHEEE